MQVAQIFAFLLLWASFGAAVGLKLAPKPFTKKYPVKYTLIGMGVVGMVAPVYIFIMSIDIPICGM